ncbi:MAG: LysM peptidoglycan-binding domain-containing protein [Phycisphaerales bacterium]
MSSANKLGVLCLIIMLGVIGSYFMFAPDRGPGILDESTSDATPDANPTMLTVPRQVSANGLGPGQARSELPQFPQTPENDNTSRADQSERGRGGMLTFEDDATRPSSPDLEALVRELGGSGRMPTRTASTAANNDNRGGVTQQQNPPQAPRANAPGTIPGERRTADSSSGTSQERDRGPSANVEYTIQPGDNFWEIAKAHFGDGSKANLIAQLNPGVKPDRMRPGDVILLPARSAVPSSDVQPEPRPRAIPAGARMHTVATGEVLSAIASKYYGSSAKWAVIYEANREVIGPNPDRLKVGMQLVIPN